MILVILVRACLAWGNLLFSGAGTLFEAGIRQDFS